MKFFSPARSAGGPCEAWWRGRSGVRAGDLGYGLSAPALGFLAIGQALVEIGPHRLAVERDHHRYGWVGWTPRRLRPKRVGKTCPRLRPGIVRARRPRGSAMADDFAHPTRYPLSLFLNSADLRESADPHSISPPFRGREAQAAHAQSPRRGRRGRFLLPPPERGRIEVGVAGRNRGAGLLIIAGRIILQRFRAPAIRAQMSNAKSGVCLSNHNPACRYAHAGYSGCIKIGNCAA